MDKSVKKIGLALGGGGARGFCHIGVIKALEEHNIPIDFISGCSMGAIVGGCYSAGVSIDEMFKIGSKITHWQIFDFDILLRKKGLFKGNKAMRYIKELIGDKQIEDCAIPFAATAVDIKTAELHTMTKGSLADAIRASFSIPIAFQTTAYEDRDELIDGGVIERIPINAVRELGAEIVIAIDAIGKPEPVDNFKGFVTMFERVYSIVDWEAQKYKVSSADLLITPFQPGKLMSDFKNNSVGIEAGKQAVYDNIDKIKELVFAG